MLTLLLFVAALAAPEKCEPGQIVEKVATERSPAVTYACYLPKNYEPSKKWPILYVFDPARRGAFGAELFRDAAETYGWIVVSSNDTDSSADWTPNARAIEAMWADAHHRFAIDEKREYASGMSGGAIMAWALAKKSRTLAGVIGCSGRLATDGDTNDIAFDWFGTAGNTDFNYIPTRKIEAKLAEKRAMYRVEIFEGDHSWPPAAMLRDAVEWMELQAMRRGTRPRDPQWIDHLLARDLDSAAVLEREGKSVEAMRRYEAIARSFAALTGTEAATTHAAELRASDSVKRSLRTEARSEQFESSAVRRMTLAVQQFAGTDDELPATLLQELDLPHLRKVAAGSDNDALAAKRVLFVTRVSLRRLADTLEAAGRPARAASIRQVAQSAMP